MLDHLLPLYTAAQTRELDRIAIEDEGISGCELMQRAASRTFQHILDIKPNCKKIIVICGMGNNGGDGYLVAKMAHAQGIQVDLLQLGNLQKQRGDALRARQAAQSAGLQVKPYNKDISLDAEIIIDALLGTGLTRVVTGLWLFAIHAINAANAQVVAVDIPSGLHADTGCEMGAAVRAVSTVTFIGRKQGLYTGDGKACAGQVVYHCLDVPPRVYERVCPSAQLLPGQASLSRLKPRKRNSHKGDHGHVLIVGGAPGMSGAVTMAASAALRSGSGLVSVATHPDHAANISQYQPEIMAHGVQTVRQLTYLIERADVIVFGPGAGQSVWSKTLFASLSTLEKPLILDADGLNLLATKTQKKTNWVLTPHPGEAARLLKCTGTEIQQDRFLAVRQLQSTFGGICVLKGAGTLIADVDHIRVCAAGNPGMASAGMGDMLTGVLAGFIAQFAGKHENLMDIVSFAVSLHSRAGDQAAKKGGERGLLATDLLPFIRGLVND
ncbi:MAG TPA: NAD(P)H-hydrate dehydratase [Gammaproteobacteria bacterium]|nr:NAD(P)H-hydrate dehydratase [Gammaproteobacteria bacterium]